MQLQEAATFHYKKSKCIGHFIVQRTLQWQPNMKRKDMQNLRKCQEHERQLEIICRNLTEELMKGLMDIFLVMYPLAKNKESSNRFCIDYCKLNYVTKTNTYPLPLIDNLLDQLGKSVYFSILDLTSGFWQIKIHQASQEKIVFSTPHGLFVFRVMP